MSSLCQRPEYVQTATVVLFAEQVVFSYQREEESYVLKDWSVFQIGKEKKNKKTPQTFIVLLVCPTMVLKSTEFKKQNLFLLDNSLRGLWA